MSTEILSMPFKQRGNRDATSIDGQILTLIAQGVKKQTEIMYKAFLSWEQTKAKLAALVKDGLVEVEEKEYSLTAKGRKYLKALSEAYEIRKEAQA